VKQRPLAVIFLTTLGLMAVNALMAAVSGVRWLFGAWPL
jgi:hypothetical protein